MEEKKADNRIIQARKQIAAYENNLVEAKDALKGIENLEDNFSHLNRNIERCVDLINSSVKNKKVTKKFDHMIYDNKIGYRRSSAIWDEEKEITRERINDINNKIEELENQIKEEHSKEEKREEKKEIKEHTEE